MVLQELTVAHCSQQPNSITEAGTRTIVGLIPLQEKSDGIPEPPTVTD